MKIDTGRRSGADDVVRGSLREFGALLNVMTGGVPDGAEGERGRPHRGAVWIAIQVAALAVLVGALFGDAEQFVDAPESGTVVTSAAWFLPGFLLAMHWLARHERRALGGADRGGRRGGGGAGVRRGRGSGRAC